MSKSIVLLVGMSGTGKTTIAEYCENAYKLKSLQSYTTRPRRTPDEKGHTFITKEEYSRLTDKVAEVEYNGNFYCATAEQVDNSDIYVIDPKGLQTFMQNYHGQRKPIVVYIVSHSDAHKAFSLRYERMRNRGDSARQAADRTALDNHEFREFEKQADYVFVNSIPKDIETISNAIAFLVEHGEVQQ